MPELKSQLTEQRPPVSPHDSGHQEAPIRKSGSNRRSVVVSESQQARPSTLTRLKEKLGLAAVRKRIEVLRAGRENRIQDEDLLSTAGEDPVQEYISRLRHGQQELGQGESIMIPLSRSDQARYTKEEFGWTTDRDKDTYNIMLFSDEFESIPSRSGSPNLVRKRADRSQVLAGGIDAAFAAGRTVLDLGSGEAVALLQYAQEFPRTTFIGIDSGYEQSVYADLKKPGVQLSKDDWTKLSRVPDKTIDTILSAQGAFMWGVGGYGGEDEQKVLQAITRVAKLGAILRYDTSRNPYEQNPAAREANYKNVAELLQQHGWGVTFGPESAVAIKQ